MKIPFTKAHGVHNDFLITWRTTIPDHTNLVRLSQAICDRHTGVGADGWLILSEADNADAALQLWNSDGSKSELSGNGTRCAALYLIENNRAGETVRIATGAGIKQLKLLKRQDREFTFEMNMGQAVIEELQATVQDQDCTILNVGNPQCAVFTADLDFNWQFVGAAIERDPRFPNRTNVSFVRSIDRHRLEVRFFERGAGETMSSGTGSTGAAAAAMARGLVESPVEVITPAGPLVLRWENGEILLAGPAEIVASGDYYL
jgi:diaminopimelate epimerase